MRVVLVGGLGFLGYHLARELSGCCEVLVAARESSLRSYWRRALAREVERLGARLILFRGAVDEEGLEKLGGDVYVHVAGRISGSLSAQREAHVALLGRVIGAASRLGARVVYISSILAYGRVRGLRRGSLVQEEERHLEGERSYRSYHALTKAEGEKLLVSRSSDVNGKWSILRPALLVGAWGYHLEWRAATWLSRLKLYPSARWKLNVVPARDVARVALKASKGAYDGLWIHLSPYHVEASTMYKLVCENLVGASCRGVPVSLLLEILGPLAPPYTALSAAWEGISNGYLFTSRRLSGFEWTPLEEAVKEFANWARSQARSTRF